MPIAIAVLLISFDIPVWGMGDPSVVYWFGGIAAVLVAAVMAVLFSGASVLHKVIALLPEVVALLFISALNLLPDYEKHRFWIDGGSLGLVIAAAAASYVLVRKSRRG